MYLKCHTQRNAHLRGKSKSFIMPVPTHLIHLACFLLFSWFQRISSSVPVGTFALLQINVFWLSRAILLAAFFQLTVLWAGVVLSCVVYLQFCLTCYQYLDSSCGWPGLRGCGWRGLRGCGWPGLRLWLTWTLVVIDLDAGCGWPGLRLWLTWTLVVVDLLSVTGRRLANGDVIQLNVVMSSLINV